MTASLSKPSMWSVRKKRLPARRASDSNNRSRRARIGVEILEDRTSPAVLSGEIFQDANGNGAREIGETSMAGVTVFLDTNGNGALNLGETSTTTDASGSYTFAGLAAGDYTVRQVVPTNFRQTAPAILPPRLFSANVNLQPNTLVELNPANGQLIRAFPAPFTAGNAAMGIAFDGSVLYVLEANADVLWELNPETGAVLDSTQLSAGLYGGLATLNGLVYVFDDATDVVSVFNPQTDTIVSSYDLNNVNAGTQFTGALGEIAAPDRLLAITSTGQLALLNPATGVITSTIALAAPVPTGLTSVGQEIFVGASNQTIRVFNRSGALLRTMTETFQVFGLGGHSADGAHRVTVTAAQVLTGLNFGNQNVLGGIRGAKFEDANGNGVRESGEGPMAGVTVFLDTNDNGQPDGGEPSTTTDAAGNYVFTGLVPGDYVVREITPTNFRQTTPRVLPPRLFSANVNFQPNAIVELNPTTGQVIRVLPTPFVAGSGSIGLAFDGTVLYLLEANFDTLYELNPDTGAVIDSTQLAPGVYGGLATLNGLVYIFDDGTDVVSVFNPQTDAIVNSYDLNIVNNNVQFNTGFGEIAAPDRLLAFTSANQIAFLNPATGVMTSSFAVTGGVPVTGLTSIGQEIFAGHPNSTIRVHNRAGALLRTLPETFQVLSLGGFRADGAHRLTLAPAEIRTGVDFGNQNILVQIHGAKFVDANGNGVRDGGEGPMAGVTVFLDTNDNGVLNGGEPSTTTDSGGNYSFTNLQPGNYVVREIVPANFQQTTPAVSPARLFSANVNFQPNAIVELNPATGQVSRLFAAPVAAGNGAHGLAFDGSVLYYLESNTDVLWELNPDTGAVLDSTQLAPGLYTGLATLNGLVYAFEDINDVVFVFNPQTDVVVNSYDLNIVNPGILFNNTFGEIESPDRLLAVTAANQVAFLDPATGLITSTFNLVGTPPPTGLTSLGQEIYIGFPNNTIQVRQRSGAVVRTMTEVFQVLGLGGHFDDGAYRLTLAPAEIRTGVDFGNQNILVQIHGAKFEDANGNGARDSGEEPMAGVTVFLDTNDNGVLNGGEPSTTTDSGGNYSFTNLQPGNYVVREIVPANFQQTTPAVSPARLFSANVNFQPNAIVELNPATGQVIRQFAAPVVAGNGAHGLAFDGSVLYYLESNTDVLWELNPDTGAVLDSTQLAPGLYTGLATLNGLVYAFEDINDVVFVFNPQTDAVVNSYDLNIVNPGILFNNTFGEIESPDRLLAVTAANQVAFLDPATGLITSTFNLVGTPPPTGLTSLGQEIYIGFPNNTIQVRQRSGAVVRTMTEVFQVLGLGGHFDNGAYRLTLAPAEIRTGVDFGNQSILGEIRGIKFEDADGNGVRDSGEEPMAGVTVFLDTNDNGVLDNGEPSATTDSGGNYSFTNLQPGNHVVREIVPTGFRQTAPGISPARLFSVNINIQPNTIVELNPATGQAIRQFAAPVAAGNGTHGLAFDGSVLYYLESNTDVLWELNADTGAVLDSTQLAAGVYTGLATLNGLVYALEDASDVVLVFNPQTDGIVNSYDLNNVNPGILFNGTLGEIESPDRLLVTTATNQVAFLNPATGLITSTFNMIGTPPPTGLTSLGQEIFIGSPNNTIQVWQRTGVVLRTMTESFQVLGLGGHFADGAHRVTLGPAQILMGVHFGNRNDAPVADAGGPYAVTEGGSVTLDASASSDAEDPPASLTYLWDLDGDGAFGETGSNAGQGDEVGVSPTFLAGGLDGPFTYTVTLRVVDTGGKIDEDTASIEIANLAPTAAISGPPAGVRGQTLTFTLTADDPSDADDAAGFSFAVDWNGDGSVDETVSGSGAGMTASHVFSTTGGFTVKVTAMDKDGGISDIASTTVEINVVALLPDPTDATKTALFVGGTTGNDEIVLNGTPGQGIVEVLIGGQPVGYYSPTGLIIVFGQDGDDLLKALPNVGTGVWLFGDAGNDSLIGTNHHDLLVGGSGDDDVEGHQGNDVIIGGDGADVLTSRVGGGLLVAGSTAFDTHLAALASIFAEWTRSDADYDTRSAHLTGTASGGLNGAVLLNASTVLDDGDEDVLVGKGGLDLFFANLAGAGPLDQIKDHATLEEVIEL